MSSLCNTSHETGFINLQIDITSSLSCPHFVLAAEQMEKQLNKEMWHGDIDAQGYVKTKLYVKLIWLLDFTY